MTVMKNKAASAELLGHLFKNASMGSQTVLAVLPHVESEQSKFKSDLTLQLNGYEGLANRINTQLCAWGEDEAKDALLDRISAKVSATVSTLMDRTPAHLADMMIRHCTVSMTDTIGHMRAFENTTASEASLALARELVSFEEQSIERMKEYV